ncbi:MAG TPA: divalent metal cation transporter [Deltaproteobacteria bacterium]|nr:divalent metal cation transporter [Deltaproteobacteria bacterium]HQI00074.1 divalent metal cation transporter [Deltaproteobacteria bacterium]HQJ09656.1 divalent metal cation transporter [Deltaproteobacteria bacterium]
MYWLSKTFHRIRRFRRRLLIFLSVLGPGIIVMIADNDAGGISTYAVTGSKYGFSLLWVFLILLPMAYYVQEMTVRVGAVTKRGQAEVIFEGFGPFWGWFSIVDLILINWLTLITEYVGMTAAMSLFGIPAWITFIAVTIILFTVVRTGQYWTFEKITLLFCLFNLVYIPAAIWAMDTPTAPAWSKVFQGFYRPEMGSFNIDLLFIILANLGTTITPWQLFFQQSAVVDKGLDIHDIGFGKAETFAGSFLTCLVAVFIIIATGAAFFYHHPPIEIADARQTAEAIVPLLPAGHGDLARKLFAIGLFDAGFLGALCISLATSWAVGEVFGWAHSLNQKVKDAPWFYLIYLLMLITSGAVVLIPGAPLVTITMYVQVVAVTLLPASLIFLLLILNDRSFMGDFVNTRRQNIMNWSIVVLVIAMSSLMGVSTLFPELFK